MGWCMSEFVEVKTAELTGPALDWAVAKALGWKMIPVPVDADGKNQGEVLAPPDLGDDFRFPPRGKIGPCYFLRKWSTDWAQGGPLIELELIKIKPEWHHDPCSQNWEKKGYKEASGWHWFAYILGEGNIDGNHEHEGGTPLIAAMRCLVSYKLGDVVLVPTELVVQ